MPASRHAEEIRTARQFGQRLKSARIMAGYELQKDFAGALGIEDGTYQKYEAGLREPKFWLLVRMAETLGVSTDYLLRGIQPAKTAQNRAA